MSHVVDNGYALLLILFGSLVYLPLTKGRRDEKIVYATLVVLSVFFLAAAHYNPEMGAWAQIVPAVSMVCLFVELRRSVSGDKDKARDASSNGEPNSSPEAGNDATSPRA